MRSYLRAFAIAQLLFGVFDIIRVALQEPRHSGFLPAFPILAMPVYLLILLRRLEAADTLLPEPPPERLRSAASPVAFFVPLALATALLGVTLYLRLTDFDVHERTPALNLIVLSGQAFLAWLAFGALDGIVESSASGLRTTNSFTGASRVIPWDALSSLRMEATRMSAPMFSTIVRLFVGLRDGGEYTLEISGTNAAPSLFPMFDQLAHRLLPEALAQVDAGQVLDFGKVKLSRSELTFPGGFFEGKERVLPISEITGYGQHEGVIHFGSRIPDADGWRVPLGATPNPQLLMILVKELSAEARQRRERAVAHAGPVLQWNV